MAQLESLIHWYPLSENTNDAVGNINLDGTNTSYQDGYLKVGRLNHPSVLNNLNKNDFSISYTQDLRSHSGEYPDTIASWDVPRSFVIGLSQGTNPAYSQHGVPFLSLDSEASGVNYYGSKISLGVHKVVVVFSNIGSKMYVDGVENISRQVMNTKPSELNLNVRTYNDSPIKDFKIFNKALTPEEVLAEYNNTSQLEEITQPISQEQQKAMFKETYKATKRLLLASYPNIMGGTYPLATLEQLGD